MEKKFISVIVPCRNEKEYIKNFMDSIIAQDYLKDRMEILIADGDSRDGTREIIKDYQKKYPYIKLLDNPKKYVPAALNIAIKKAKGDVVIRIDTHAKYDKDYISKCVRYLDEYKADNVGGNMKTIPAKNTLVAKSIALCMSHGFGVRSYFRKGSSIPREVDTVFGGCYKKEVFDKIGLFNENLKRSQDMEFNLRLKRAGGKIILVPDIVSYYYPKTTFREFFWHNFVDGKWAIIPLKITKKFFKPRHYALLLMTILFLSLMVLRFFYSVMSLLLLLFVVSYISLVLASSFHIAFKEKDFRHIFSMPIAFVIRHIGYGLGSLAGFLNLFIPKKIS